MRVIIDIIMPEAPRPVMARPTMSASMLGADAATTEPISKTVIETRKTILWVAKLWRKCQDALVAPQARRMTAHFGVYSAHTCPKKGMKDA